MYSKWAVTFLVASLLFSGVISSTILREYVERIDPLYSWNLTTIIDIPGQATIYNVFFTSQSWLTTAESSGSIWTHFLQICVPVNLSPSSKYGFLYVTGGNNAPITEPPTQVEEFVYPVCSASQTIVSALYQVPNQPIDFTDDPDVWREEDDLIAHTWAHFIEDPEDTDWVAQLPMTKSGIKALDTIQAFTQTYLPGFTVPSIFTVSGASKRGWTAWLMGCVGDPRIGSIIPIVAPTLNLTNQMLEMYQSYGNWSFALDPYVEENLMSFLTLNITNELFEFIDPINYIDQLEPLSKYIIVASRDEFFIPNGAKYYYDALKGEKYLYIVGNAGHSLTNAEPEVLASVSHFYLSIIFQSPEFRPTYSWQIQPGAETLSLTINMPNNSTSFSVLSAQLWISPNMEKRDWREYLCMDPNTCQNPEGSFQSSTIEPIGNITTLNNGVVYEYEFNDFGEGYSAYFIQLQLSLFTSMQGLGPMRISSDMVIYPENEYPYAPCGDLCSCGWDCGEDDDDDTSTGVLVGVIIGSVLIIAGVVAAVAVAYWMLRKKAGYERL